MVAVENIGDFVDGCVLAGLGDMEVAFIVGVVKGKGSEIECGAASA